MASAKYIQKRKSPDEAIWKIDIYSSSGYCAEPYTIIFNHSEVINVFVRTDICPLKWIVGKFGNVLIIASVGFSHYSKLGV